jgi:inosine/xanthosine triphosphatase
MNVAVGSGNPVKRRAVARALPEATVEAVVVESGVPEQPVGHAQTVTGAERRAERALPGYDLAVGIEGGVASFEDLEELWLVMWAAATDGERWGRGSGPSIRLPEGVAARIEAGAELGPVMDDLLGTDGIARKEGAAGALTGGIVDRESSLTHAVGGALGPFVTGFYG